MAAQLSDQLVSISRVDKPAADIVDEEQFLPWWERIHCWNVKVTDYLREPLHSVKEHVQTLEKERAQHREDEKHNGREPSAFGMCGKILSFALSVFEPLVDDNAVELGSAQSPYGDYRKKCVTEIVSNVKLLQSLYEEWLNRPAFDFLNIDCFCMLDHAKRVQMSEKNGLQEATVGVAKKVIAQIEWDARKAAEEEAVYLRPPIIVETLGEVRKWHKLEMANRKPEETIFLDQMAKRDFNAFLGHCISLIEKMANEEKEAWNARTIAESLQIAHRNDVRYVKVLHSLSEATWKAASTVFHRKRSIVACLLRNVSNLATSTTKQLVDNHSQTAAAKRANLLSDSSTLLQRLEQVMEKLSHISIEPVGDYCLKEMQVDSVEKRRQELNDFRGILDFLKRGEILRDEEKQALLDDGQEAGAAQLRLANRAYAETKRAKELFDKVYAPGVALLYQQNVIQPKLKSFVEALESLASRISDFDAVTIGVEFDHPGYPLQGAKSYLSSWAEFMNQQSRNY